MMHTSIQDLPVLSDVRVRYVKNNWKEEQTNKELAYEERCYGKWIRNICNFGAMDIHWLIKQKYWFANKFDPDVDPRGVECVDVIVRRRAVKDAYEEHMRGLKVNLDESSLESGDNSSDMEFSDDEDLQFLQGE